MTSNKKSKGKMKLSQDSISALIKKKSTHHSDTGQNIKDEEWKNDISNDQLINPDDFYSIEISSYATTLDNKQKTAITLIDFASDTISIKAQKNTLEINSKYNFSISMNSTKCNLNFTFEGTVTEKNDIDEIDDLLIISSDGLKAHPFSKFQEQLNLRQNEIITFLKEIKGLAE